ECAYVTQLVIGQDSRRKARHPLAAVPNDIGDIVIGRIDTQAPDGFVAGRAAKRSERLCPSTCVGEVVYLRGRPLVSRWRRYIQSRGRLGLQRSDEIDHVPDLRVGILFVEGRHRRESEPVLDDVEQLAIAQVAGAQSRQIGSGRKAGLSKRALRVAGGAMTLRAR